MQPHFLRHHLSQFLYLLVDFVLDALDQQSMRVGTVDVHEISSLLQIYAASLVAMDEHHEGINLSRWTFSRWTCAKVFNGEERVIQVHILINI
jgi:hypothetical protein